MFVKLVILLVLITPGFSFLCPDEFIFPNTYGSKYYFHCLGAYGNFQFDTCNTCLGIKDGRFECSTDVCNQETIPQDYQCDIEKDKEFDFKAVGGKEGYFQYCVRDRGDDGFPAETMHSVQLKCAKGPFDPVHRRCNMDGFNNSTEPPQAKCGCKRGGLIPNPGGCDSYCNCVWPPPFRPVEAICDPNTCFHPEQKLCLKKTLECRDEVILPIAGHCSHGQRDSFNLCPDEFIFASRYGSKIYWTCKCAECDWYWDTCDKCFGIKNDRYECSHDVCNQPPQQQDPSDYHCDKDKDKEFDFTAVPGKEEYFQYCVRDLGPDGLTAPTMTLVKLKCSSGRFNQASRRCESGCPPPQLPEATTTTTPSPPSPYYDCPEELIFPNRYGTLQFYFCKCAFCEEDRYVHHNCTKCLGMKNDRFECSNDVCNQPSKPEYQDYQCEKGKDWPFHFKSVEGKPEYYQFCVWDVTGVTEMYQVKVRCACGCFNPDSRRCENYCPPPAESTTTITTPPPTFETTTAPITTSPKPPETTTTTTTTSPPETTTTTTTTSQEPPETTTTTTSTTTPPPPETTTTTTTTSQEPPETTTTTTTTSQKPPETTTTTTTTSSKPPETTTTTTTSSKPPETTTTTTTSSKPPETTTATPPSPQPPEKFQASILTITYR